MKTDHMKNQHLLETEQTHDFFRENTLYAVSLLETIRRGDFKSYQRFTRDSFVKELIPYIAGDIELCKLYVAVHISDLTQAGFDLGIPSNVTTNLKKESFCRLLKAKQPAELEQITIDLARQLEKEYKKYNSKRYSYTIRRAIEYINFRRFQATSTSDIAVFLKIEQTSLSRRFHQEVGMTITDYIHTMKTDMAYTLILQRQYTLTEISDMLGYKNYQYFCRVFKKYKGCLPSKVV